MLHSSHGFSIAQRSPQQRSVAIFITENQIEQSSSVRRAAEYHPITVILLGQLSFVGAVIVAAHQASTPHPSLGKLLPLLLLLLLLSLSSFLTKKVSHASIPQSALFPRLLSLALTLFHRFAFLRPPTLLAYTNSRVPNDVIEFDVLLNFMVKIRQSPTILHGPKLRNS